MHLFTREHVDRTLFISLHLILRQLSDVFFIHVSSATLYLTMHALSLKKNKEKIYIFKYFPPVFCSDFIIIQVPGKPIEKKRI